MKAVFVAWRPSKPEDAGWRPVGRLEHDGHLFRFFYTQGARKPGFRLFQGMDNLSRVYESEKLFPLFANRLLSESRPEYQDFLRWSGLDAGKPPDPIVELSVSEGLRQTDMVEVFPCPTPNANGCYFNKFFLHGIRWVAPAAMARIDKLEPGEMLKLFQDFQNENDANAVGVRTERERMLIGYVPRYLARDILTLAMDCFDFLELKVDRVNRDAPLQNRLLCRLEACWPDGFRPCSGEDFEPIPAGQSAECMRG